MLTGLMTFVANRRLSQVLIGLAALVTAGTMIGFHISDVMQLAVNGPVGIALIVAAFVAIGALAGNGLPDEIGRPKDVNRLTTLAVPVLQTQLQPYYLAVIAVILLIQHAVAAQSDWAMILMIVGGFIVLLPWLKANAAVYLGTIAAVPVAAILLQNRGLAGLLLSIFGGGALLMLAADAYRAEKVERERMTVVLILMFFSMLFWAFFEQAGSSVSMFTDRNVDRIVGGRVLTSADVGKTQDRVVISSALLGRDVAGQKWNLSMVNTAQDVARKVVEEAPVKMSVQDLQKEVNTAALKAVKDLVTKPTASNTKADSAPAGDSKTDEKADGQPDQKADQASDENSTDDGAGEEGGGDWSVKLRRAFLARELQPYLESVTVTDGMVGMKIEGKEVPASMFQAANAIFILIFGLVFTLLWALLASIRLEPNTAVKFSLGLLQLGLGFVAFWWGAKTSNGGIVAMGWLLLGYMFHTTGELCLSPVGLSMVTKLSPPRMVSTVMGAWFLATAFSNFLAGMIAALTGIGHGTKERGMIPFPDQTVNVYGNVFYQIAVASIIASVVLLVLSPLLVKWMHQDKEQN
jgi:POT family proton-dependent oligopeptide transporter